MSQTESAELPQFSAKVSGSVGEYRERLIECIAAQEIVLEFKETIAPALGMSYGGRIATGHEQRQAREATYDRILENAPAMFSAAQLRVLLRAIVNLDPYTFADDLAEDISAEGEHQANQRSAEEVLLSTLDSTVDDRLTRFALRLALSGHRDIPRKDEIDFLTEADAVFPAPQPQKAASRKAKKADPRQGSEENQQEVHRSPNPAAGVAHTAPAPLPDGGHVSSSRTS